MAKPLTKTGPPEAAAKPEPTPTRQVDDLAVTLVVNTSLKPVEVEQLLSRFTAVFVMAGPQAVVLGPPQVVSHGGRG